MILAALLAGWFSYVQIGYAKVWPTWNEPPHVWPPSGCHALVQSRRLFWLLPPHHTGAVFCFQRSEMQ